MYKLAIDYDIKFMLYTKFAWDHVTVHGRNEFKFIYQIMLKNIIICIFNTESFQCYMHLAFIK